jgi:cytochrome P450/DNA-binding transcriptional regulator YbjK
MAARTNERIVTAQEQGERTRARILTVTAELIAEVGWGAVTTRLVAERAGVNNAAVNYHFSTKAALLRTAAVAAVEEAVAEPMRRMAAADGLHDALVAWARWVEAIDPRSTTAGVLLETMLQASRDDALCRALRGSLEAFRGLLAGLLEAEWAAGRPGAPDAGAVALVVAAALDGLALHRLVDADLDLSRATDTLAAVLTRVDERLHERSHEQAKEQKMTTTPVDATHVPGVQAPTDEFAAAMAGPEFRADPYPLWHRLRATDPVHQDPTGMWLLTRYADVEPALRDSRFSSNRELFESRRRLLEQRGSTSLDDTIGRSMLSVDPPDHTRLRKLVNKAFTPRRVEGLRPRVTEVVDELLTAVEPAGGMDLIADLAYPLPVTIICELLGVPVADRDRVSGWSRDLIDVDSVLEPSPEYLERLDVTVRALGDYLRDLVARRRARPADDLLSALVAVRDGTVPGAATLSEEELLGTAILLLLAGHVTTINLIGNGTLALLRHPDQLRRLQEDPSLVHSAVEELLRYDSPVQVTARALLEDVETGGKVLPAGSEVLTVVAAANRDPERFREPDRLDLTRPDNRHLSFGGGIHFCLGAPLARLEGEVALRALAQRLPGLQLATDEPTWRPNPFLRGLESLPVTF